MKNKTECIKLKNVMEVRQPIGRFLVGVMKASDLVRITHQNTRKYNQELDDYVGIQREVIPNKIKQLKKFIHTADATFPNTVIGTLKPGRFDYDTKTKTLCIDSSSDSFAVIDGQHRLASFDDEVKLSEDFDIVVTFYLGLDMEEQAYLFSIINMTQTRLSPSLAQDLTELFTITTTEKLAHTLAKIFNTDKNGPWFNKIKMLGKHDAPYKGILSQYTFTKGITGLIADSSLYYDIRNILKVNKNNRKFLEKLEIDEDKYILWRYYVAEEDKVIYTLLKNFFDSIRETFSTEWGGEDYILTKTTGYLAFMRLFRYLYNSKNGKIKELNKSFFKAYLKKIKPNLKKLNSTNYQSGVDGENKLYKDLIGDKK